MEKNTNNTRFNHRAQSSRSFWLFTILALCFGFTFLRFAATVSKPYELKEVFYKQTMSTVVFDVKIADIRKEKDKEDVYNVKFEDMQSHRIRFDKLMSKSEFDKYVGLGNNTLTSIMYSVDYNLVARHWGSDQSVYALSIHRFSAFDEGDYTSDEATDYAQILVQHANARKDGKVSPYGTDRIESETKSLYGAFAILDVDKFGAEGFKPVVTDYTPSYMDTFKDILEFLARTRVMI